MLSERQQQIIDESVKIIANKGIQGLTIKTLAKSIGISEPGIYRHFESKTEILLCILVEFKKTASHFSEIILKHDGNAIEKMAFMFTQMIDLFIENKSIVSVMFAEEIFKNEIILKDKIFEIVDLQASILENIILQGQSNNIIRNDVDEKGLALIAMGSLRLMVKKWDFSNHSFCLSNECKNLIGILTKIMSK